MRKGVFTYNEAVLPIYFPKVLFGMLCDEGYHPDGLLAGCGLKENDFEVENIKLSLNEHKQFIKNVLEVSQNEHIGWNFGKCINLTTLGTVGYGALSSETLKEALEFISQFLHLRTALFSVRLGEQNNGVKDESYLEVKPLTSFSNSQYFLLTAAVSAAMNVIQFCFPNKSVVSKIEMQCQTPKSNCEAYLPSRVPIVFNKLSTRIYLHNTLLNASLPTADSFSQKAMYALCAEQSSNFGKRKDVVTALRKCIKESYRFSLSLDDAAAFFYISPRTLRRALSSCGTHFKSIVNEEKAQFAKDMLSKTNLTVAEIALQLNFSDPSNFGRAFKAWTGVSPVGWRERGQ